MRVATGHGTAAEWHALEVPVPDRSRLQAVAGGLPGREPPRTNRLLESIASALAADADGPIPPAAWLVAESRRIGNAWIETLARTGHPIANAHVTTVTALAYDIAAATLAREGLALAPPRAKRAAVERVLRAHRHALRVYGAAAGSPQRLAEQLVHSLDALRNAGITPRDVERSLRRSVKGHDLALLLERYTATLREMKLVDQAGEVALAIERVRAGGIPPTMTRLLVPDDLDLPRLERDLLAALRASPGVVVTTLATDPPPADVGGAVRDRRFTIFRAVGEANEVRHVIRTCVRLGLRFDEVEVVHTDPTTYPALVRELVAALPLPLGSATAAGSEPNLPVTFAEGLPLAHSRPGRAVAAWLAWRRDGHPQAGLEAMLRDGLLTLDTIAPGSPRPASLVRELRGIRIGRGLDRSLAMLAAAAARASERPADAFTRGGLDDGAADDDPADRERLQERKERHCRRLEALRQLVERLAACEAGPDPTAAGVLAGSRDFVENLCPHDSELDGNARRVILDEIAAMETWGATPGAAAAGDMLDWLERLPATLVVLGSGPRPGCLHVSGLAGGGHAGRPYTFVLGLDENRFPGAGATDPVLTDGDRTLLNAVRPEAGLTVARDTAARTLEHWRRLLGRLRGEVWLGFSCRDTTEDVEMFPSAALVALHGQSVGKPLATVADLLGSLPPPETLVPHHPDAALDESQWWLATLGPEAAAAQVRRAVAAHRDHLAHGQAAVAARNSPDITPHDGLVPSAGPLLDPRAERGRTASPNSLEVLGTCPRRFFFRYALGVESTVDFDDDADRWLNAIDAGSLLHTVLERFMGRVVDRHELPAVDSHLAELLAILDEELAAARRRHPPLTELSFHTRRVELQAAMRTFLHEEERCCRERGLRPLAIEVAIGLEPTGAGTPFDCPEAVVVSLAPGETIRLRGRIDRIDVRDDGGGGAAYALWDYKSGSGHGFPAAGPGDPFLGGRKLQHGLYVVMLQARLAAPDCGAAGTVERFGYFFPTRMGKGRRLEWTSDELADCTSLVRRLAEIARRGAFVPTTNPADCDHCDFARVCGDTTRVTRDAARMLAQSEALRPLFTDVRDRRPPAVVEPRRPHPRSLHATPHPDVPGPPPDDAVRRRIREDLGTTLLVEAAAGTGKTTCMVDRMLALVRSGTARPEGIVAVTFTKKAAGELRRRFREAVQAAWAATADDTERGRLTAALDRLDSMMIGTIHSFAGRLLRERPIEAGVDPGFRELDDPADRLLRRRAWRDFVTAAPADHVALLDRLDAVGLRLADLSRLFIDRFAAYGDVEAWPAPESPPPDAAAVVASLEAFVARIEAEAFPPPAERGSDELMSALEQVARMFRRCDGGSTIAVMELLEEFDRTPKVTQSSWPGGGTEAEAKAARKAAALGWHEAWNEFREQVAQPALWTWRAHRYPPAIAALQAARDGYDRLRMERGVLSFQDLLCRAATLLANDPEVRQSFRSRYTHVLVDEFQDTDPVQAQLLVLLTATDPAETDWRRCRPAPGSLFVVGDPKQSLYRFRRADIVTYAAVRAIVERHGDVLALTTNFRSRADLVEWVNGVFRTEFPPAATPESPSFTASTSGRQEPQPAAAGSRDWLTGVRTLRLVRAGQAGAAWAQREAREIAAFVRGAIDSRMAVPRTVAEAAAGVEPACQPGDFLIVTPERRHLGIYAAALHEVGLPVDVTGTLGEHQADPLRDLRTCLAVLADPDDAVAVLALLRGPVFGFSDAELFDYKTAGGRLGGPIDAPARLDPGLRARFAAARDTLLRWQTWTRHLPVAATVERVIDDAGLMLLAAADGAAGHRGRAVAGLFQTYLEQVRTSRLEVMSTADCLDLLDDLLDASARADFDPLAIDVPSTDRVRVMNLHKAKGLEAAVVFLADYQRREAGDTPAAGPFLHVDRSRELTEGWLAITTPFGRSQRIVAAPPDWPMRCGRERGFEVAEQIRLDYVAATRAASCLVVSLFERHDPGTRSRPESYSAEGGWARFGPHLTAAADLPEPAAALPRPIAASDSSPSVDRGLLPGRIADCLLASFARISPRELLTEPAEGIRFTGRGLGEPWGRAIHRLLERAVDDPGLDLAAAAATALSNEDVSPAHVARAVATVRSVMASVIWRRALASPVRHAELPFSVQVGGGGLPERVRRSAGIAGHPLPTVVRGVIDLVFLEPAAAGSRGWTVVDWKTDSVSGSSAAALADHYRPQVELYADCWRLLVDIHGSGVTP